jgi:hypothetical protein
VDACGSEFDRHPFRQPALTTQGNWLRSAAYPTICPTSEPDSMAANPTVSELRKTSDVTDDEITAAVDAVLADLASEAYPLAKGWVLDLVAAVANHKASQDALLTDREAYKRNMVRTAILLAHPVKG